MIWSCPCCSPPPGALVKRLQAPVPRPVAGRSEPRWSRRPFWPEKTLCWWAKRADPLGRFVLVFSRNLKPARYSAGRAPPTPGLPLSTRGACDHSPAWLRGCPRPSARPRWRGCQPSPGPATPPPSGGPGVSPAPGRLSPHQPTVLLCLSPLSSVIPPAPFHGESFSGKPEQAFSYSMHKTPAFKAQLGALVLRRSRS